MVGEGAVCGVGSSHRHSNDSYHRLLKARGFCNQIIAHHPPGRVAAAMDNDLTRRMASVSEERRMSG
ncbi:MAG TPA: hypothetical protein VM866_06030 [Pyrinomonadaceae bacterium]|nr:hypothetical protein [Pyrinomonadaceae bacterium]